MCRLAEPRKGLDRIILTYHGLVKGGADVPPLVLAGKGRLGDAVAGLIGGLGLSSRVSVRSDVLPDDLPELYRGASVFVQASHEEGLGLASVEATESGLPIVASETAGSREVIVAGVTGWLVSQDPGDKMPMCIGGADA